jgi:hypothetical protein
MENFGLPNYYTPMKTTKEKKNNETPILVFLFCGFAVTAQNSSSKEFTYTEFLGYVKKYHPLKCQFRNQ